MPRWIPILTTALLFAGAECAHGQQTRPSPQPDTEIRVRGERAASSLGLRYGGGPVVPTPDGSFRLGNYPTVRAVVAGSNAERAGLAVGDTILAVNGRDARLPHPFPDRQPGTRYVLQIRRDGQMRVVAFTPGSASAPGAYQ